MASATAFLERKLRLKVNQQKSAVAPVGERQFLGYRLGKRGTLGIGRKSLDRAKESLREATRRNRGMSLERMVAEANRFTVGWVTTSGTQGAGACCWISTAGSVASSAACGSSNTRAPRQSPPFCERTACGSGRRVS
jgi:RNA-directed DNA polymerase